jgi:hypothetical protein
VCIQAVANNTDLAQIPEIIDVSAKGSEEGRDMYEQMRMSIVVPAGAVDSFRPGMT